MLTKGKNKLSLELALRLATGADINNIANLHALNWRENYTKSLSNQFLLSDALLKNRSDVWSKRLGEGINPSKNQYVAVAELKKNFAGFICIYRKNDPELGTLIDNLHVNEKYRNRGIASALIHYSCEWLSSEKDAHPIYLEVYYENNRARDFYLAINGRLTSENPFLLTTADGGKTLSHHVIWDSPTALRKAIESKL